MSAWLDPNVAELVVAHAIEPTGAPRPPGIEPLPDPERRREAVEQWAEPARAAGRTVDIEVRTGDPRTVLVDVVGERAAGLLVVGSHGRGSVTQLVLGSAAPGVVQRSATPVAVVAENRFAAVDAA